MFLLEWYLLLVISSTLGQFYLNRVGQTIPYKDSDSVHGHRTVNEPMKPKKEKLRKKKKADRLRLRATCSCHSAAARTELVPASPPPVSQQHRRWHSVRDALRRPLFSPSLPSFPSPPPARLLTFSFPVAFCSQHGRVHSLIPHAASLSIYLSSCVFPSRSASRRQGLCCQALPEQWGCQE